MLGAEGGEFGYPAGQPCPVRLQRQGEIFPSGGGITACGGGYRQVEPGGGGVGLGAGVQQSQGRGRDQRGQIGGAGQIRQQRREPLLGLDGVQGGLVLVEAGQVEQRLSGDGRVRGHVVVAGRPPGEVGGDDVVEEVVATVGEQLSALAGVGAGELAGEDAKQQRPVGRL